MYSRDTGRGISREGRGGGGGGAMRRTRGTRRGSPGEEADRLHELGRGVLVRGVGTDERRDARGAAQEQLRELQRARAELGRSVRCDLGLDAACPISTG